MSFLARRVISSGAGANVNLIDVISSLGLTAEVCLDVSDPNSYSGSGDNILNVGSNDSVDYFVNDGQSYVQSGYKSYFTSSDGVYSRITENSDALRNVQNTSSTFIGVFMSSAPPPLSQACAWTNWNNFAITRGGYAIYRNDGDYAYGSFNNGFIEVKPTARNFINNWVFHAHSNGSTMIGANAVISDESALTSGTVSRSNVGSAATKFTINGQQGTNWTQVTQRFACFAIITGALTEQQLNEIYTAIRPRFK